MKTITCIFSLLLVATALTGCSTHSYEKTTRTQTVISEEPVLGQPAHAAPRP